MIGSRSRKRGDAGGKYIQLDDLQRMIGAVASSSTKGLTLLVIENRIGTKLYINGKYGIVETWEDYWALRFPSIPLYYKHGESYKKYSNVAHMEIYGRTAKECMAQAYEFLVWYRDNK